ncbi:MAG TPA: site-specific integrase [Streptosporangiaceae bacterium]|nr:site-specific integrase [Streptosporangiaceae bacterium]
MGYLKERTDRNGNPRYTACYVDPRGALRSAGTYSSKKETNRAWQRAETKIAEGRLNDPRRGRQTFRRYVTEEWLPNHVMEVTTREAYTYQIGKHILPWFGPMRMNEIMAAHVREWVTHLQAENVSAASIQKLRFILSAIFTSALDDVTFLHPCKGVKTPTVPTKLLQIITPEQFDAIYKELPDENSKLLVETDIETGARWGELTEFRVKDLDPVTRILTISRTVIQVDPKFHPSGQRFLVKEYPKDGEYRRLKLSKQVTGKITAHIAAAGLGKDNLLFVMRPPESPSARLRAIPDPAALGFTKPNAGGRQYRHGTMSGYNAGKCRCRPCKDAAAIYRASRRAEGKDEPRRPRTVDSDGHISRDWFRQNIWRPAIERAGITFRVRPHDMRHAHASWLLAGGADLQMVKERLGHGSLATTQKYLHTLPDTDDEAVDAFTRIRTRTQGKIA